jgi:hypothetical protein
MKMAHLSSQKFALLMVVLIGLRGNAAAQNNDLPDWSQAGYRNTGVLPTEDDITSDPACVISAAELADGYQVVANDEIDDSAGLQNAIDTVRDNCAGSYNSLSLIELPSGTIHISTEIHVDASFLIVRGQGSEGETPTQIIFEPGEDTIYDGIPDFDLNAMEGPGSSNGGWIWPGRGAFRVQTRALHPDYAEDYENAAANRRDFFGGSVNFHWKSGIVVTENSPMGNTTITLEDTNDVKVGDSVWVGAPNTANKYNEQGVDPDDWSWSEYMRQQIFSVVAIEGDSITLDRPLEFDLPHDSTADGSEPIDSEIRDAKVIPLTMVERVGFENFSLTQILPGRDASEAVFNYSNIDPTRAINGIVFKWASNSYIRGVHTYMTGSHAVVTEMVRHIQIQDSTFEGSWNKGEGGNGYFRLSKAWDSLVQNNTLRGLRHLAVLWSASYNVIQGNDIDADINLHGGWERFNLFQNNIVRVPYDHGNCNPGCGTDDETWYPIWWASGAHGGNWAGASGPQNVFYNNTLQKQLSSGGDYEDFAPYGASPGVVFMFGWDRDSGAGSHWVHLAADGERIDSWTSHEQVPYQNEPNAGINAWCRSSATSLVGAAITCTNP